MVFLGRKPVGIRIGQWSRFGQNVSKGIVDMFGDDNLLAVNERGDVSVSIGVEIRVSGGIAYCQSQVVAARQQASACARESQRRQVVCIALLDYEIPVVDIMNLGGRHP